MGKKESDLQVAWFNAKYYAVRVLGKYPMIAPNDPLWKELSIQDYIDNGLVLSHDFDHEEESQLTEAEILENKITVERTWRDSALNDADILFNIAIDKGSNVENISAYRERLRDYPTATDFPIGNRPTLSVNDE